MMVGEPTTSAWLEGLELFFYEIHGKGATYNLYVFVKEKSVIVCRRTGR